MSRIVVSSIILALSLTGAPISPAVYAQVHFQNCARATGHNATVIIPNTLAVDFGNESLSEGDEIAVFTSRGLCAGVLEFAGQNAALTIWGDDPMTEHEDGFAAGDSLRFVVWDASANEEHRSLRAEFSSEKAFLKSEGTYAGNAIYSLTSLTLSTLELGSTPEKPLSFNLAANYPNPFNPSTLIQYTVPEQAQVMLDVINALGRQVKILVSEVQSAGTYDVHFDGGDLPSGTYLYRLIAGQKTLVRQMVLLK